MRKRMKNKKCSCGLCKPNKRGIDCRWTNKELDVIRRSEIEILNILGERRGREEI